MTPTDTPEADPFRVASDSKLRTTIESCLERLPDAQRSVLHLFYWMGLSVAEISETLSTPQGTIKSILYRARARLHEMLKNKGVTHA